MLKFPIRMVLFDYGNVIARVDHRRFFMNLLGPSLPEEKATELVRDCYFGKHSLGVQFESGTLSFSEFQKRLELFLAQAFSPEVFRDSFNRMFENVPATFQLIRELHGVYRLGLLSNTNDVHFEDVIRKIEIFSLFDQVSLSYQVGVMKPDLRIFQDALAKSGCHAEEILYLDDIEGYVEAGRSMGFQAICCRQPELVMNSLRGELL